jgi:hypothetical protein
MPQSLPSAILGPPLRLTLELNKELWACCIYLYEYRPVPVIDHYMWRCNELVRATCSMNSRIPTIAIFVIDNIQENISYGTCACVAVPNFTSVTVTICWFSQLIHSVQTGSGAHSASYPMGVGALSPGVKRQGRETGHSPLSNIQDNKGRGIHRPPPPIRPHEVVLN